MDNPIWRYHVEEMKREGRPPNDESIKWMILSSFVVAHLELVESMCGQGYKESGRGTIIHVPEVVGGRPSAYRQIPSRQFYVPLTQVDETLRPLVAYMDGAIAEALIADMERYNPNKEFISSVVMTFDNNKPTPLDWFGWLTLPYTPSALSLPDYDAILASGLNHLESGDFDQAVREFTQVIEGDFESVTHRAQGYYGLAIAYQELGKLDLAIQIINKNLELRPTNALGYAARGIMYYEKKEYEKALADVNKAIKLNPQEISFYDSRQMISYALQNSL